MYFNISWNWIIKLVVYDSPDVSDALKEDKTPHACSLHTSQ